MMISTDILNIIISIIGFYLMWRIFDVIIFPQIVYYGMKEVERNPKWITSRLQYYGFNDIDIVTCHSKWGRLPKFRAGKNKLELWVDANTSVNEVEEIGRLALAAKLNAVHGVWFPEKPLYWLSVLCYLLDGGDIKMEDMKWKENKKPLD